MSDLANINYLLEQKASLESLISGAIDNKDVVGEMNFTSRLQAVEEALSEISATDTNVAEVAVLFDGEPVDGSYAIDASFASRALAYFQKVVTTLYSSRLHGQINSKGKIKGADLSRLNISGLAFGSFGFVLEEKDSRQSSVVKTPVREALEEAAELFEDFAKASDDEFLIDVNEIDPRVFNALGKFFQHLEQNQATLKTNFRHKKYSFDRREVNRAYERFSSTEIKIETETWLGTLVGLSPVKRIFEFRKSESTEIVTGKFGALVSQDFLERINGEGVVNLGAEFRVSVEIRILRRPNGTISTTYTATDMVEI